MISRSARAPRDFAEALISRTLLGGIHRASVDLRFGLTAIPSRETRACFQAPASDARCARPISTTRSRFADISMFVLTALSNVWIAVATTVRTPSAVYSIASVSSLRRLSGNWLGSVVLLGAHDQRLEEVEVLPIEAFPGRIAWWVTRSLNRRRRASFAMSPTNEDDRKTTRSRPRP